MDRSFSRRGQAGISGNILKIIAVLSMFIDHMAVVFIENGVLYVKSHGEWELLLQSDGEARWYTIYWILRFVGRIAFPIFCFLLTEGYIHTRDKNKYTLRLLLFAIISEVPFNLMVSGYLTDPGHQNVYFTLLIGLLVLRGYEHFNGSFGKQMMAAGAGFLAAYVMRTDYDMIGVAMILILYQLRNEKRQQLITGALLGFLESLGAMGGGALAFIPIWLYNGQRGKWNMKYFFYWFYPAHILLLVVIRNFIFGPVG